MNHTEAALPGSMDMDPLSSYEYPTYEGYAPQPYPYTNKLQQSIYQAYQQTSSNYINNARNPQDTFNNPLPTLQSSVNLEVPPKYEDTTIKPVVKRRKKEKTGQKSTYCSEKITDATFKFYGCAVCNVSYNALHELDQHVTVHKNRMTSYRLRLRNQIKKKQIKKEKKKLKKMIKIKKENELDIEIKPEDGYIGEEKATDFVNNEIIPSSECNENFNNMNGSVAVPVPETFLEPQTFPEPEKFPVPQTFSEPQTSEINSNNGMDSVNNELQSNETNSLPNGTEVNSENNEIDNRINSNSKENSMDEAELNNLEKIYKCFACQKQFTLSYYLKLHVRSHTDEKPYSCGTCGQAFITASKLGRHNKRIHLASRYQCRVCFKIYSRFEQLTAHFDKTHPEDKLEGEPYDYNAILPYLKELEEQLRAPPEQDSKPKVEDLFWEEQVGPQMVTDSPGAKARTDIKEEDDEDQKIFVPKLDITIEEVKVDFEEFDIKREAPDDDAGGAADLADPADPGDSADPGGATDGGADVKGEDSLSDEDYFPSNTWAASPAPPSPAAPPEPPPGGRARGSRGARVSRGGSTCDVCHKVVSSASYMRVHMRTHTGEKPFKCYKCGRGFITSSKMHRHVLTHAQDKDDVKTETEDTKPDVEELAADGEQADDDDKPLKKKSKQKSSVKNGGAVTRRKHQKRPHACEYCNQKFLHVSMLEVHKQSHSGEELVLRCHYCVQEQPDAAALQGHQAQHKGPKPYLCTLCGKTYKKRETMIYHRKRHSSDAEFVCDICSKRFGAVCKLRKHMTTHRAERFVLRYECPVCAHMFHTKYHVHMHLRTHTREGLIAEEHRSQVLAMVMQNARKLPRGADASLSEPARDERSRVCNICGEVFQHFYYLEEHLKSHGARISVAEPPQDDKKYVCPVCSKAFKLHYYLKLHSFTHSKEKPFICQQCGKGFITKGKLKRHLETHSGLKKYQCHICYKFFTRPSYLRIHVRTIHGTQDYNFRFDARYGLPSSLPNPLPPSLPSDLPSAASDVSQNSI